MSQPPVDGSQFQSILEMLADGDYHSGESIGEKLGISRAAVWKQLKKLQGLGLKLRSVKGRGYVVDGGIPLLDISLIKSSLTDETASLISTFEMFSQIDSTNSYLLGREQSIGGVCLAEAQSFGRGRRGRQWFSPFGRNIYMSVAWGFEGGVAAMEGLSLAVGVAIANSLEALGLGGVELKWPNDLLFQGKKLGGILIEMTGDPAGYCRAVIGIGINFDMAGGISVDEQISQPWTDIKALADENARLLPSKSLVVASILNELFPLLNVYVERRFSFYLDEWIRRAAYRSDTVVLQNGSAQIEGRFLGVNKQGALRLMTAAGEGLFYGGEVSLRRKQ